MPKTHLPTGREYLRVSFDRSGHERSNDEQHDENVAAAPGLGVGKFVGEPYSDLGSASRHQRRGRKDFDQLLDDLGTGRFGADVLVIWEASRGSRKVGEWVTLIDLCETAGVKIMVTTHGRLYDPANARDRRSLLEDAVDSEYESAKASLRIRRAAAATAVKGRPHGRAPFGYRRVYDPVTGKLVGQEPDPVEAPVVVELFDRLAAGHSLGGVAKDFAARGITSRGTKKMPARPLAPQTLRCMALGAVYAGKRTHTPGSKNGDRRHDPTTVYDAEWPALVSDATYLAVRARITDPARVTTRPGRGKHLLSMVTYCDVCDGPLAATYRDAPRKQYQCHLSGHVRIDADALDAWAENEILGLLAAPDVLEGLLPEPADDVALADARDEVARVRAEHTDLIARVAAGALSATMAAGAEPGILARLKAAEDRAAELVTPVGLRGLIDPGPGAIEQWEDDDIVPMAAKREIVRLLFSPGLLGKLAVAQVDGDRAVRARIRLDGKPLPAIPTGVGTQA